MNILPGDNVNDIFLPFLRDIGSFGNTTFKVSRFELRTFRDLRRTTKSRFAKHDLLNQKPQLEFIGQDLTEITFKVQLLKSMGVDVAYEADKLRWYCEKGGDYALVIGGEVIGRFVVEQVSETAQVVNGNGEIMVEELELTLREYVVGTNS